MRRFGTGVRDETDTVLEAVKRVMFVSASPVPALPSIQSFSSIQSCKLTFDWPCNRMGVKRRIIGDMNEWRMRNRSYRAFWWLRNPFGRSGTGYPASQSFISGRILRFPCGWLQLGFSHRHHDRHHEYIESSSFPSSSRFVRSASFPCLSRSPRSERDCFALAHEQPCMTSPGRSADLLPHALQRTSKISSPGLSPWSRSSSS